MASFPLKKNAHFPTYVYSTPNLKMFPLHCIAKILYAESNDTELIIRAKIHQIVVEAILERGHAWQHASH